MFGTTRVRHTPCESLDRRRLFASVGTLLQYDFNSTLAWASMAASSSTGVTANVSQTAVGTIDVEGGTTKTGAVNLAVTAAPAGVWTSDLASGQLAVTNAEKTLDKLTLAFSLSASQAKPVKVLIASYDAQHQRTGGLVTTVYPPNTDSFQRFAVDLSTMTASGAGSFNPAAPYVSFNFEVGSASGWSAVTACQLRVDNVNYARAAYYVDPVNGSNSRDGLTEGTAFRTPQQAVNVAQPGDIILLMGGTYTNDAFSFPRGGTAAAWVTVKNYPGQSPLIYNENWNAVLIGRGTSKIKSTAAALGYIEVRGLHVRGNADTIAKTHPELLGATDARTNNNGITVDGRYETNHPHDIRFADDFVEYCSAGGIGVLEGDRIQIENNVVQNTSWWTKYATSGISILSAYSFDGNTAANATYTRLIRNNVSRGNQTFVKWVQTSDFSDGNGIILDYNHNSPDMPNGVVTNRTLVTNNVSFNNGGSGIHTVSASHVDIINNTAYLNSASPELEYPEIFANSSSDVRIYNNILVAPVADTANGQPAEKVNGTTYSTNVVYKNNVYFGGNVAPVVGSSDSGNLKVDPKFVTPSTDPAVADFRLQSSSLAVNLGTATLAPIIDYDYMPRFGLPDAGAIEYVPPAPAAVVLAPASDTGVPGDNKTRLNNASAANRLSFSVTGTVSGATVQLFSGTTLIGSATAAGTTTTVTTNGTAALADGTAAITATQTFAGAPSAVSPATAVVVDTKRPTLAGTPVINAGSTATASRSQVRSITWTFSEPVNVALDQFTLTNRDTGVKLVLSGRTITTSGNTAVLTLDRYGTDAGPQLFLPNGNYALALSPTAADAAGNTLDANGDGTAGETPTFRFFKLLGDYTGDRRVSTADYLVWRTALNGTVSTGTDPAFDLNGTGTVANADYLIWREHFNAFLDPATDGLIYT